MDGSCSGQQCPTLERNELMNTEKYRNAMNSITADEELIASIHTAAVSQPKKARSKSRLCRTFPLIAAAVVMLAGFTVYAANSGLFSIIFNNSEIDFSPFDNLTGDLTVNKLEVYLDGLTVTPVGTASDSYTVYTVFKLDFPQPLPESNEYSEFAGDGCGHFTQKLQNTLAKFSEQDFPTGGGAMGGYVKGDEDTLYYIYTVSSGGKMSGNVELDVICQNLLDDSEGLLKDRYIYSDRLFYADFTVNVPEVEGIGFKTDGTEFETVEAKVFPCSIVMTSYDETFVNAYKEKHFEHFALAKAYVTLKDGSTVDIRGTSIAYGSSKDHIRVVTSGMAYSEPYNANYFNYRGYLSFPVDTSKIVSLTIGNTTIYPEK